MQDLKVLANFDWTMFKTVTCTVNSTTLASIEIYQDQACTDEHLATFTTAAGTDHVTTLSVPVGTMELYLKYNSAAGEKVMKQNISSNSVVFNVTDAVVANARSLTKADTPARSNKGLMDYPAGWGVVMFEDLYPGVGDYDFNDFVAAYQITLEYPQVYNEETGYSYDTEHVNVMRVHLKLRAIGGSLPYTPYVRVVGLNKDNVTTPNPIHGNQQNPTVINNTTDGVELSLVDSPHTSDVIIQFKNLNGSNPNRIQGGAFFNTEPGFMMKKSGLTEAYIYLKLNEKMKVSDLLDDKIDLFLASPDQTKEIHLRGFKPVFSDYDYSVAELNKDIPYATQNNLVWGIKVPQIMHAIEKTDFSKAYPDFAGWATSGGVSNQDWYKTNVVKENLVEWKK